MKNKTSKWGTSLRDVRWTHDGEPDDTESLISRTVSSWFDAKHERPSEAEIRMVNSHVPDSCPWCGGGPVIGHGRCASGMKRYRCRGCGRSFTPISGTIFDSRKIAISEWIEYLYHIFEHHSLVSSSRDNRNAQTTGRYWIAKVFSVLEGIQDNTVLSGDVYYDETYFEVESAPARKKVQGPDARYNICVGVATDGSSVIMGVLKKGGPSSASVEKFLRGRIAEGSAFHHDGHHSHMRYAESSGLRDERVVVYGSDGAEERLSTLNPINDIHSLMKGFMSSHPGYDRRELQDWLNLMSFVMSDPQDVNEKVRRFIELAFSKRVILRYRDVLKKTPRNSGKR